MRDGLEPARNLLVRLAQQLDEVLDDILVPTVEERRRHTRVTRTSSTTNAVHVVVDVGGKIVVDDMRHVRDIEPTRSDSGSRP